VRARGRAAAARAHRDWTWERSAAVLAQRVDELLARPPRAPLAAPETLAAYAFDLRSTRGEDGLLDELFGRLRVVDPTLVELGPPSCAPLLIDRCGWSSVGLDDVAPGFDLLALSQPGADDPAPLVARYQPRALVVATDDGPPPFAARASEHGYAPLALSPGGAAVFLRADLVPFAGFAPAALTS
jgi:hypothetical protein